VTAFAWGGSVKAEPLRRVSSNAGEDDRLSLAPKMGAPTPLSVNPAEAIIDSPRASQG
jgi:hypothetical protein